MWLSLPREEFEKVLIKTFRTVTKKLDEKFPMCSITSHDEFHLCFYLLFPIFISFMWHDLDWFIKIKTEFKGELLSKLQLNSCCICSETILSLLTIPRGWFNTGPCRGALSQPSKCPVPWSMWRLHITLFAILKQYFHH